MNQPGHVTRFLHYRHFSLCNPIRGWLYHIGEVGCCLGWQNLRSDKVGLKFSFLKRELKGKNIKYPSLILRGGGGGGGSRVTVRKLGYFWGFFWDEKNNESFQNFCGLLRYSWKYKTNFFQPDTSIIFWSYIYIYNLVKYFLSMNRAILKNIKPIKTRLKNYIVKIV